MTRSKNQVYSVGNYLMTGKVLGKGNFARVEEATHRAIGKKVAIKIIDLSLIKEEYAQRNLHREPRIMARLCHPCIAALYETMMHGPRLFLVMEAAGGGDLHDYVHSLRGGTRGIPEARARSYAAQLVSAVRHMHDRGVVHRDLKTENIMLDSTKQFIKIVDFGLSNLWSRTAALRTPCGSLEYAAPEIFVGNGPSYGPQVDLWSIGVIVYAMLTGSLPFTAPETGAGGEPHKRTLLCQRISKGYCKKHAAALACASNDCKIFIQHLLEPDAGIRMKIEEAARNRWLRISGLRMKMYPFGNHDAKLNKEINKEISELTKQPLPEVEAQIKADPFGQLGGIYNIKLHHKQLQTVSTTELLWSSLPQENRPKTPPIYKPKIDTKEESRKSPSPPKNTPNKANEVPNQLKAGVVKSKSMNVVDRCEVSMAGRRRLPCIEEHSSGLDKPLPDVKYTYVRKVPPLRKGVGNVPAKPAERPHTDFCRKTGIYSSLRSSMLTPSNKVLLQNSTNYKRYSLGSLISPHSSSNSHCKTERPTIAFCSRIVKEESHLHRLGRYTPAKLKYGPVK